MNRIMNSTMKRITVRGLLGVACIISLALQPFTASSAVAATTLPVLWTAGGLSAGNDAAGQAARMATDAFGNVAVVSGPAFASLLAVTSYTASGAFRWRSTVSPSVGTFEGAWVVAAPNGDFLAVGYADDFHGYPRGSTLVRYASDGTLRWRVDLGALVSRLVVDTGGNAYLAISSQDIQLLKYDPSGVLLWATGNPMGDPYTGIAFGAQSLALSPDQADVVLTGNRIGGAAWITAAFNATTGAPKWMVMAAEGIAALDVVVDATRVYVTGEGNVGIYGFLTVVAYDRATGVRLWRRDANPPTCCAIGLRIALAPDGSLVVAGRTATGGYFDWWIVAMNTNGAVRWQALRDAAVTAGDESPAAVFVLADGTTVVSGTGGPVTRDILGNSYMQGVTAGYSPNGTLLWEGFSKQPTVWATALPNGDVCATGGYDALITCFQVSGVVRAVMSATPSTGTAPLSVTFDGSGSTTPNGTVTSWAWSFGDGASGTGPLTAHVYSTPGTYAASLTVTDSSGASSRATGSIVVNPLPPAAPSGLTASLSGFLVQLTWQDNSSNETVFYIERCAGGGCTNFASFATQWPDVPSYTDYAVIAGQSYSYRVRAYNAGGYSPYSNIASIVAGSSNQPPTAVISATPSTGAAPLTVTFGGSGSTDPDGTIASYSWNFGDGGNSTAFNPSHTYTSAGTYTATLTVTDNDNTSASAAVTIIVNPGSNTVVRSTAINLSAALQGRKVSVTGNVVVKNASGAAVSGAVVSATWARPGGTTAAQTATTSSTGIAKFSTSGGRGTYTLTVGNITKTGYTFDAANSMLTKSITR